MMILQFLYYDYRCAISGISKSKAVNLLQNADLSENSETLQTINLLTVHKNGYKDYKVW